MKYLFIIASFIGFLHVGWAQSDEVSLRDKIGQMLIVGFDGTTIDEHSSIVKMIQVDHMTEGIFKHFAAICPISKLIFAYAYRQATALTGADFLKKLIFYRSL